MKTLPKDHYWHVGIYNTYTNNLRHMTKKLGDELSIYPKEASLCVRGFHGSPRLLDSFSYCTGRVIDVRYMPYIAESSDEQVVSNYMRLVGLLDEDKSLEIMWQLVLDLYLKDLYLLINYYTTEEFENIRRFLNKAKKAMPFSNLENEYSKNKPAYVDLEIPATFNDVLMELSRGGFTRFYAMITSHCFIMSLLATLDFTGDDGYLHSNADLFYRDEYIAVSRIFEDRVLSEISWFHI